MLVSKQRNNDSARIPKRDITLLLMHFLWHKQFVLWLNYTKKKKIYPKFFLDDIVMISFHAALLLYPYCLERLGNRMEILTLCYGGAV